MASRAGLHTVGRRILAMAAEPDPPRPRARLRLHRVDRAHYPCRHARGAAAGLYPHRPRQGSGPAQHPVRSCAEKRSRSDRDGDRYRHRPAHRRRGGDRKCVRDPGPWPTDDRRDPAPRLPGHPGHRPDVQLPLCAGQPDGRRHLHSGRPEDPLLTVSTTSTVPMPPGLVIAPQLPDLLLSVKVRRGVLGFLRNHPTVAVGGGLLLCLALIGIFAPYLGTVDPTALAPAKRTRAPSADFWFGTDVLGRDVYSRVLYGARVSLTVGLSVALFASLAGLAIGLVSGCVRSADSILMRFMDGLMSIPPILLAIALMALTRGSVGNVILAITVAEIPRVSRLVRSVVLSLREQPYVDAAVACGTRTPMIILRHILPNTLAPMLVQATYICASAMIVESVLSFIGAGTPPTIPSWGNIMAEGRALWQVKPYIVFFPAAFLSVTVLAVNLLGDGLRDALDPRMAKSL